MSNPYQPIMETGWVDNPTEAVTHIYRMQDKRDPFRYMDFDPRAWNFIVVPILPDEAVVGYTNADQPEDAVIATCDHEWIDARNEVISSGQWCRKCNAIRAEGGNE